MPILHLIRHAAYPLLDRAIGGRADHELSPEGHAQAAALAEAWATKPVRAIFASPVRRAQQTAAPLAARLRLPIHTDADLTEIDFGAWTGASFDTLALDPAWQEWNKHRATAAIPGGETMLQAQCRAMAALARAAAAAGEGEVALVTHADIVKAILLHLLGAPLDAIHRLEIAPASISTVRLHGPAAQVLHVNRMT